MLYLFDSTLRYVYSICTHTTFIGHIPFLFANRPENQTKRNQNEPKKMITEEHATSTEWVCKQK